MLPKHHVCKTHLQQPVSDARMYVVHERCAPSRSESGPWKVTASGRCHCGRGGCGIARVCSFTWGPEQITSFTLTYQSERGGKIIGYPHASFLPRHTSRIISRARARKSLHHNRFHTYIHTSKHFPSTNRSHLVATGAPLGPYISCLARPLILVSTYRLLPTPQSANNGRSSGTPL